MVGFAGLQLSCALASKYSFVIHMFLLSYHPLLKLAHRIAVIGTGFRGRGTDGQSVDAAGNVVNFLRRQFACVPAAQDSVVFVHNLFLP